ncbi:MAG: cytochrome oxidase subunit III [Acidobacteriota bacterium]
MSAEALRSRTNDVALLAVLSIATMLFTSFTAAYVIRRTSVDWDGLALPGIVWLNTALLLGSSATIEAARRRDAGRWLAVTAVLAAGFACGQVVAWRMLTAAGTPLGAGPHAAFFYVLTGVHAAHLAGGLGALWRVMSRGARAEAVRLLSIYWHFLAAVWLYVLLLLTAL